MVFHLADLQMFPPGSGYFMHSRVYSSVFMSYTALHVGYSFDLFLTVLYFGWHFNPFPARVGHVSITHFFRAEMIPARQTPRADGSRCDSRNPKVVYLNLELIFYVDHHYSVNAWKQPIR